MKFKTYVTKNNEFAEITTWDDNVTGFTSDVPVLFNISHTKENLINYLKKTNSTYSKYFNWDDYKLITVDLKIQK